MTRWAIVNVNLQYKIPDGVKSEASIKEYIYNLALPRNYITDSFEIVKIIDDKVSE